MSGVSSKIPRLVLFAAAGLTLESWCAEVSIAAYRGPAGSSVPLVIAFSAQRQPVSAVQFDLEYDSTAMNLVVLTSDNSRDSQKNVLVNDLASNRKRVMVIGLNRTALAEGTLAEVLAHLKADAPPGVYALAIQNVVCSDPGGVAVPSGSIEGSMVVEPPLSGTTPITREGVLNAASMRSGPVAPGELIVLMGSSIGPSVPAAFDGSVAGTVLGGARVLVNGLPAPLTYASSNQINATVPYAIAGDAASIVIESGGSHKAEVTVPVAEAAPAIFTLDSSGTGAGAILNQDYSINSIVTPAERGSVVMLYATGAGQTDPPGLDVPSFELRGLRLSAGVWIGGKPAEVLYAGTAPGPVPGLIQINARVPFDVEPGIVVPVVIELGSRRSPGGVTMAVR